MAGREGAKTGAKTAGLRESWRRGSYMRIYVIVGLLVMTLCGLNLYVIHTTVGTCTHNLETKSARVTWLESQLKRMKRGNEDLILQVRQDRKALQRLTQAQRRLKARLEQVAAHSPQLPTTVEAPGLRHADRSQAGRLPDGPVPTGAPALFSCPC